MIAECGVRTCIVGVKHSHGFAEAEPSRSYAPGVDASGHYVAREDDDGAIVWRAWSSDAEAARYAAMLLESGIDPDELDAMLQREQCSECDAIAFVAELEPGGGRCSECQS